MGPRRIRPIAVALALALALGACSGDGQAQADGVPDVDVQSVPSGDTVNVAEIALGRDTLFWFWAPH